MNRLKFLIYSFKKPSSIALTAFGIGFMGFLFYFFSDFEIIRGNLGITYAIINLITQILITFLFGINLALLFQRHVVFSKQGASTTLGGLFGALIAGCPACGITLAGILGFGSILSVLPFFGLELKIFGLGLLIYAFSSLTSKKCKFKPSKR